MSKQKKYHYIYKTTCLITGKFYVGMHSTDNLEDNYLGSGKILGYSRAKYGDENHVREILEYISSRQELKNREKEIVNEELLSHPLNMNLKYGGDGGWEKVKGVLIQHQKIDVKARAAAATRTISKRKENSEYNMKLRKNISEGVKKAFANGCPRGGTKGMSFSKKPGAGSGEKNSQFGTCWVTNSVKSIKIKKEQLEEYLANGYLRGRK